VKQSPFAVPASRRIDSDLSSRVAFCSHKIDIVFEMPFEGKARSKHRFCSITANGGIAFTVGIDGIMSNMFLLPAERDEMPEWPHFI
jgi:hypothetical protein